MTPSATSVYYIQHAQQCSGLFVPQDIPCGYISELFCSFRYAATTSTAPAKTVGSKPRSRAKTPYNLRRLVKAQTEPRPVRVAAFWALPLTEQAGKLVELARNALSLMLGLRTRYLGFLYLGGTKPPALLELAPAVWNAQYFQVSKLDKFCSWDPNMRTQRVVSRAQLIPYVSSALANSMSTQSPELRRKIGSLVPGAAADSGLEEVLDELQRRSQILLLRSARDQKIKASFVQKAFTGNDFTDNTNLDRVNEPLHLQVDSQSRGATSDFAGHDLMHLELESSRGFMGFSAGSAEGNTIDLGPEDPCVDEDMEFAGWMDGGMVSCTSESLLEHSDFYDEECVWGETPDPTHGDRGYQKQHDGRESALQEHGWDNTVFHHENDSCDHHYEMSDVEEGMQPTAHYFENCSSESNRAAMALEDSGDDLSDFASDEDDVVDTEICDHLWDEGEWQNDPCESNDDHGEPMLHGGDTDDEPGPNYITWGHVDHSQPEVAGDHTGIGLRRAPDDWSQVPRNHVRHGIDERVGHTGPHRTVFTTRLTGHQ